MRVYYRIALGLVLICLVENNVLGAPKSVERNRELNLPHSGKKDFAPLQRNRDAVEAVEQSGEGSGDLTNEEWMSNSLPHWGRLIEEQSLDVQGSGEIDNNDIVPERKISEVLSEDDLKQDNIIQ